MHIRTIKELAQSKAQRYLATRKHYPNKTAVEVLHALRYQPDAKWLRSYAPDCVYNPRFSLEWSSSGHYRWIEDTAAAGLRFVGHADEIDTGTRHKGWYTDYQFPDDSETLRGAVWQLPARDGCAQYVHGYADPNNDSAALVCFDIEVGDYGGSDSSRWADKEDALITAARCADSVAESSAEHEKEYRLKDATEQHAAELREEAATLRSDLCAEIRKARKEIAALIREADEIEEYPGVLLR